MSYFTKDLVSVVYETSIFNPLMPGGNKRSYILEQPCCY